MDGAEGGTGAAPPEFSNSVGMPLIEGLTLVNNILIGAGVRHHTKVICAGKVGGPRRCPGCSLDVVLYQNAYFLLFRVMRWGLMLMWGDGKEDGVRYFKTHSSQVHVFTR